MAAAGLCCGSSVLGALRSHGESSGSSLSEECARFSTSRLSSVAVVRTGVASGRRRLNGYRIHAWFKFGKNGLDSEGAGIYGSQGRDDFDRDDVEQYFNYMGMLAMEGTYDKMEALLSTGTHPVDILLLLAASEGDVPKIEELLRAGADPTVNDDKGRTALDRAKNDDIRELIISKSTVQV